MKKLRVLVLMHESLVPPDDLSGVDPKAQAEWQTELDVVTGLRDLGHEVIKLGVYDELQPIKRAIGRHEPHIAFNLMEEFHGDALFDQHVVSYLELLRLPYTGCNPSGLILARDKALSKSILAYHRVPVPGFAVFPMGKKVRRPKRLDYPVIVKSLIEQASLGIAQASVVTSDEKLVERVQYIHERLETDAIAERYIEGRELYVGVLGRGRVQVMPTWEIDFSNLPADQNPIATAKVKWDADYQKRHGITWGKAQLTAEQEERIQILSKRAYDALRLSGYARLDYRMNESGKMYLLEANPNPNIAKDDEFAQSGKAAGLDYGELLQRILNIGLKRQR